MYIFRPATFALALASLVSACSGGGEPSAGSPGSGSPVPVIGVAPQHSPAHCDTLGSKATVTSSCINCPIKTTDSLDKSIDGDVSTYGTSSLYHPDDTASEVSQVSVKATASPGLTFPAGQSAGVIFGLPSGSNANYSATINTYLSSVLQESKPVVVSHTGASDGSTVFLGFGGSSPTTKAFDSIELSILETAPGLEQHTYKYFEFCSNSGN